MQYELGVDLGTTYTAAAIHRADRVEMVMLGSRAPSVPSVVFLREDETILTGEAADRRALTEQERVAREFKRRVGDPTPLLLGGTPYSAERLMAKLLRWVVDTVAEREGGPPTRVAVSHPANWGPYKLDLLEQAVRMADLPGATTLTEPQAAATWYASTERVDPGEVVAVYDLGGGTFDAAILRKSEAGFEILGRSEGIERLGGIDFDEAVFAHVRRTLGDALDSLDPGDPSVVAAVARLRHDCIDAKEALSADTDARIPVLLPGIQTEVRLTRAEFEAMVRPALTETVEALHRALTSAGVSPNEVRAVLLVGGSSRIPLVAQLVSAEFGRPVAVDAHPKHAIAMGAALAAAEAGGEAPAAPSAPETVAPAPPVVPIQPVTPQPAAPVTPAPAVTPQPAAPVTPLPATPQPAAPITPQPATPQPAAPITPQPAATAGTPAPAASPEVAPGTPFTPTRPPERPRPPVALIAATVIALVAFGGLAFALLGGGDGKESADTTQPAAGYASETTRAITCEGPSGRCARITDIRLEGDHYAVDYMASGFTPDIDGGPFAFHVHFFFDTTTPENAGTNGPAPGFWEMYDGASPFTTYGPDDRGEANKMCIIVSDAAHRIEVGTGNCADLPD